LGIAPKIEPYSSTENVIKTSSRLGWRQVEVREARALYRAPKSVFFDRVGLDVAVSTFDFLSGFNPDCTREISWRSHTTSA
jgi:hypothetical protein